MKKHFRKPGHSYDASKPVSWPSIVLASAEKYGPFMVAVALRKLHATGKLHAPEHCPVCQEQRKDKAA